MFLCLEGVYYYLHTDVGMLLNYISNSMEALTAFNTFISRGAYAMKFAGKLPAMEKLVDLGRVIYADKDLYWLFINSNSFHSLSAEAQMEIFHAIPRAEGLDLLFNPGKLPQMGRVIIPVENPALLNLFRFKAIMTSVGEGLLVAAMFYIIIDMIKSIFDVLSPKDDLHVTKEEVVNLAYRDELFNKQHMDIMVNEIHMDVSHRSDIYGAVSKSQYQQRSLKPFEIKPNGGSSSGGRIQRKGYGQAEWDYLNLARGDNHRLIGLEEYALANATMTKVHLDNLITKLSPYSFYRSQIRKLTIDEKAPIVTIPEHTFSISDIEELDLGKLASVQGIGDGAFANMPKLRKLVLPPFAVSLGHDLVDNTPLLDTIVVPYTSAHELVSMLTMKNNLQQGGRKSADGKISILNFSDMFKGKVIVIPPQAYQTYMRVFDLYGDGTMLGGNFKGPHNMPFFIASVNENGELDKYLADKDMNKWVQGVNAEIKGINKKIEDLYPSTQKDGYVTAYTSSEFLKEARAARAMTASLEKQKEDLNYHLGVERDFEKDVTYDADNQLLYLVNDVAGTADVVENKYYRENKSLTIQGQIKTKSGRSYLVFPMSVHVSGKDTTLITGLSAANQATTVNLQNEFVFDRFLANAAKVQTVKFGADTKAIGAYLNDRKLKYDLRAIKEWESLAVDDNAFAKGSTVLLPDTITIRKDSAVASPFLKMAAKDVKAVVFGSKVKYIGSLFDYPVTYDLRAIEEIEGLTVEDSAFAEGSTVLYPETITLTKEPAVNSFLAKATNVKTASLGGNLQLTRRIYDYPVTYDLSKIPKFTELYISDSAFAPGSKLVLPSSMVYKTYKYFTIKLDEDFLTNNRLNMYIGGIPACYGIYSGVLSLRELKKEISGPCPIPYLTSPISTIDGAPRPLHPGFPGLKSSTGEASSSDDIRTEIETPHVSIVRNELYCAKVEPIRIFTMNGKLALSVNASYLDLRAVLPNGMYILKINGETHKFALED
ncbi:hypothetical protein Barb6XT_00707 [Bacteroidales bacterium Barb6XT]|nr:hypothetical protein Barb6XT_00707 [Bacteroidales bacterium Barb6XT]